MRGFIISRHSQRAKHYAPRPSASAGPDHQAATPPPNPRSAPPAAPGDPSGSGLRTPALVAPELDSDPGAGGTTSTPAQLAAARLGDAGTPTETFGSRRLDLRTAEAPVRAASDTPAPLTARGLSSVRREAGAGLFPDGHGAPGDDDGWEDWARGLDHDDGRMAQLDDDLGRRRTRFGRFAARRRSNRQEPTANPIPRD